MSLPSKEKRRHNDSMINKTLLMVLAVCASLITYIYISNQDEDRGYIRSIAEDVKSINEKQIISYAHQQNMDARIEHNEEEFKSFKKEAFRYWRGE